MEDRPYTVVVFTEDDTVDVVATKWLTGDGTETYWPPSNKKGQPVPRLVMGLASPNDKWKKCPIVIEHSYGTYNLARKAAIKKADNGKALNSDVTDGEKGRGKRRVMKKRHFDDSDNDEIANDVIPALSILKKKKAAVIYSDSDDDREPLPAPPVSGIREQLKSLLHKKAVTAKDVLAPLNTDKNIAVSDLHRNGNLTRTALTQAHDNPLNDVPLPSTSNTTFHQSSLDEDFDSPRNLFPKPTSPSLRIPSRNSGNGILDRQLNSSMKSQPFNLPPATKENADHRRRNCSTSLQENCLQSPSSITSLRDNMYRKCNDNDNDGIEDHRKNASSSGKTYSASNVEVVKVELLQEINSKLDFVMIQNQRILKKLYPEEAALKKPKDFPSLPLQSEDDFQNFEKFLQIEVNISGTADLFQTFASGCAFEGKAAGTLMKKCISNRLSRMMSWDGTSKTKLNFSKSNLKEAIFCALLKLYPKSKLSDGEAAVKRWLNTSAQRLV